MAAVTVAATMALASTLTVARAHALGPVVAHACAVRATAILPVVAHAITVGVDAVRTAVSLPFDAHRHRIGCGLGFRFAGLDSFGSIRSIGGASLIGGRLLSLRRQPL